MRPETTKLEKKFDFNEKKGKNKTISSTSSKFIESNNDSKKRSISEHDELSESTKSVKDSKHN